VIVNLTGNILHVNKVSGTAMNTGLLEDFVIHTVIVHGNNGMEHIVFV
jgi:hypothetical protein